MNIRFRQALQADVESIISVQNRSFYDDYLMYGECPAYNESRETISRQIETSNVYVIEGDGEIIGDIIVCKRSDERYYLRVLCVIPEYHNLGIGKKAIEFIENDIKEVRMWELVTPFKSFRNHHFYEKMGYIKVGEYMHSEVLTLIEYRKETK